MKLLRSQIGTLERGRHSKYLPFAFTEQGVAMLSGILNSKNAIQVNIAIMRVFVQSNTADLSFLQQLQCMKPFKERRM